MQGALSRLAIPILLCLTLGLAPFTPEPHIVGKLRWVAGGAVGMKAMDWFDLAMHGAPFVLLAVMIVLEIVRFARAGEPDGPPEPPK